MSKHPGGVGSRWWETPGSLRASLLRLDGQVGAVVNAEKQVACPAAVPGDLVRHVGRIARQMGIDAGDGTADCSDRALVFESIKPSFTREAGSSRRTGPAA